MTEQKTVQRIKDLERAISTIQYYIDQEIFDLRTMSVKEAMQELGVSRPRINAMCNEGTLTSFNTSDGIRILCSDVANRLAYIEEHGHKPRRGKAKKGQNNG